jgi:hypothetical protein
VKGDVSICVDKFMRNLIIVRKKFCHGKASSKFCRVRTPGARKRFFGLSKKSSNSANIYFSIILAFGSGLLKSSSLQRGSRFRKKLKQTKIRATGPQEITTAGRWVAK